MSNDKTDAEFIAECEAAIANDGQIGTYQGIPVIMTGGTYDLMKEAVERLKRANKLLDSISNSLAQQASGINTLKAWIDDADR